MTPAFTRRDAAIKQTRALPAAASATVYSAPIDLQKSSNGQFLAPCEVEVVAPAVTTTMVPDTKTMTYSLVHGTALDSNGLIDTPSVLQASVIVQTGAASAGAAAATYKTRLPQDVGRYVALKVVSGANTTDSSAKTATLDLLF